MIRKSLTATLGLLIVLTASGTAMAAGSNTTLPPSATEVNGTVVSVTPVCTPATDTPATGTPATGTPVTGTPATGTPAACDGLQPNGYVLVVKNQMGQEYTLTYKAEAKINSGDGVLVGVANLQTGAHLDLTLVDEKPISVEVKLTEKDNESTQENQSGKDQDGQNQDNQSGKDQDGHKQENQSGKDQDGHNEDNQSGDHQD